MVDQYWYKRNLSLLCFTTVDFVIVCIISKENALLLFFVVTAVAQRVESSSTSIELDLNSL